MEVGQINSPQVFTLWSEVGKVSGCVRHLTVSPTSQLQTIWQSAVFHFENCQSLHSQLCQQEECAVKAQYPQGMLQVVSK